MTRVITIVVAVALGAVLFFAPLLPLSFLVKHGSTTDAQESLAGPIDEEVMEAIVLAVRQHDKLGWSFREPERQRISVAEYFFTYDGIGILSIEPCVSCEEYSVTVRVGVDCGGWCGGGELYCVKDAGESWKAEPCGWWVE